MTFDKKTASLIHAFQKTGYLDYLAARCLINNNLYLQGSILASTAIEKYVKGYVLLQLKDPKSIKRIHFDKLKNLRLWLQDNNLDILRYFDANFLEILSSSYKLRYYDNITEKVTVGFIPNQLLGELDYFVHTLETKIYLGIFVNNKLLLSDYHKGKEANDSNLVFNNYILENRTKVEHMQKADKLFCIHVNEKGNSLGEVKIEIINNFEISVPYDNNLITIWNVHSK